MLSYQNESSFTPLTLWSRDLLSYIMPKLFMSPVYSASSLLGRLSAIFLLIPLALGLTIKNGFALESGRYIWLFVLFITLALSCFCAALNARLHDVKRTIVSLALVFLSCLTAASWFLLFGVGLGNQGALIWLAMGTMTCLAATHFNWLFTLRLPKPLMILRGFSMLCSGTLVATVSGSLFPVSSLRATGDFNLVCFLFACSSSALLYMIHRLEYVPPGEKAHT